MTTAKQSRPAGNGTAQEVAWTATPSLADAGPADEATRARCLDCGHGIDAPLSVARGYGPTCWRRRLHVQLDARRDALGRRLRAVAALVARLDADGLAIVSAALEDAVEALDAEGVAL